MTWPRSPSYKQQNPNSRLDQLILDLRLLPLSVHDGRGPLFSQLNPGFIFKDRYIHIVYKYLLSLYSG